MLLPFLFLLYITALIDRVNVGFAGLEMTRELHFSNEVCGFGSGIFFFGYRGALAWSAQFLRSRECSWACMFIKEKEVR